MKEAHIYSNILLFFLCDAGNRTHSHATTELHLQLAAHFSSSEGAQFYIAPAGLNYYTAELLLILLPLPHEC